MASSRRYALCVKNRGYAAALEVRKVYRVLTDARASKRGLVRVIDESGEDYVYPRELFVPIRVPEQASKVFVRRSA